ncbi:MAG TPA: hypothetical protein VGM05_24975 [Planctomycetaceae bacterium]|jgi:hypothetical protein
MGWLDRYPLWFLRFQIMIARFFVWLGALFTGLAIVGFFVTMPVIHLWKLWWSAAFIVMTAFFYAVDKWVRMVVRDEEERRKREAAMFPEPLPKTPAQ